MRLTGTRIVTRNDGRLQSITCASSTRRFVTSDNEAKVSLLDRLDAVVTKHVVYKEGAGFEDAVLEGMLDAKGTGQAVPQRRHPARHPAAQAARAAQAGAAGAAAREEAAAQQPRGDGGDGPPEKPQKRASTAGAADGAEAASGKDGKDGKAKSLPGKLERAKTSKLDTSFDRFDALGLSERLWTEVAAQTDEIYCVHEKFADTFRKVLIRLVTDVARDDEEAALMVQDHSTGGR